MKWIKASERQPEDWEGVKINVADGNKPVILVIGVYELQLHCLYVDGFECNTPLIANDLIPYNELEWLDESPEPVTIGIDGGPLYRPYFQIGNQTFYIDAHNPEDYNWYVDQMEAAFKKLPVEVKRID